jgi:GNAT superfamily N-acetyltransferase
MTVQPTTAAAPVESSDRTTFAPDAHGDRDYHVVLARPRDLPLLPSIELAAARLLAGHAPSAVLNETTSQFALRKARRLGRLWVVLSGDEPVGFAHVMVHERGVAHLEEVDVHPDHGRRGLGRRLVQTVCAWATSHGFEAVTLTTFRDVPWNMPFYARLGFVPVAPDAVSVALHAVIDDERRRGLDPARRVVMRYHA